MGSSAGAGYSAAAIESTVATGAPLVAAAPAAFNFTPWLMASGLIQGVGQLFTARNQAQAITQQAAMDTFTFQQNAKIAEFQAADAIDRGEVKARDYGLQVRKLIGAQRARLAAQGMYLDTGDALSIQEETAMLGALDVITIRENAYREAFGYKTQALNYNAQAAFAPLTGKAKANQTLLTGGLQFANTVSKTGYQLQLLEIGR